MMKKQLKVAGCKLHVYGLAALCVFPAAVFAQTTLSNQYNEVATLSGAAIEMYGRSELHITGSGTPISGCTINLHSPDSWVFLPAVAPSSASALLGQFKINGLNAVLNNNVKVVQYGQGAVLIPYPSNFQPLEIYDGENFSGSSLKLSPYTAYNTAELDTMAGKMSSFILKRGYTATFAQNPDGSGRSRNYVAADGDLDIGAVPDWMDNQINFIRIFPWRWTGKKGSCDMSPTALNADWHYNWDINKNSTLDWEYAGIRQTRWWPGLNQNWQSRGINHLSGYNEPANPVEDAYTSLNNGDVNLAVSTWSDLLATGLRVGAPAVTDGGRSWLYSFIDGCDAAGKRVDYVPIHYYRSYWNNDDPAGAASQMYNFLKEVHDRVQRPIWVTEFNNGANWSDNAYDPSTEQNKNVIEAMINMMDDTPWIERYAVYSRVEWFRQTHYGDGSRTAMGQMYHDHDAPISYVQSMKKNRSRVASYYFEGDCRDSSGCGNNGLAVNIPVYSAGKHGQAIDLGGACEFVQLPGDIASSGSFSFAAWVYWDGGAGGQRIFDFGNYDLSQYMVLSPNQNGQLNFGVRNGGSTQWVSGSTPLPSGSWQHVAVTLSGGIGTLYLNGVQQGTASITASALSGTTYNYLGKSQWSTDPLFSGKLDDVHIANYALSSAEITALKDNTTQLQLSSSVSGGSGSQGVAYSGSVAGTATDADAASIIYSKVYGPAWLSIDPDGTLSGTPGYGAEGPQIFTVRVRDDGGERHYFMLTIDLPYVLGNGTWTSDSNGLWSDTAKWSNGFSANGSGNTADFSTINLSADRTVSLDSSRTIGTLNFGDTFSSQAWTLNSTGGVLSLDSGSAESPVIAVNTSMVTIEASMSGTNGFSKSGAGTLILAGSSSLSGTVDIDTGETSGNGGTVRAAHPSALAHLDALRVRNNNNGYSSFELDGALQGDVASFAAIELSGRNVSVPAIRNRAGENVLAGGITTYPGGTYYGIQSDAGTLELGGLISSAATGASRTWTFSGIGDTRVSGIIENGDAATVSVVKTGSGRLLLQGINTYNGTTSVSAGELVVTGSTGSGSTTITGSATLSGSGVVNATLTGYSGSLIQVGERGFPLGPDTSFALVDDFERYSLGANGTTLAPVWVPGFPAGGADAGSAQVGADTGSGQALRYVHGGSGGQMNYASVGTIASEGATGTIFFQADLSATGSDTLFAFGRTGAAGYSDLGTLFRVPSDLIVEVHNGGYANTSTSLSTDTLYNFWVVIDNSANTSSLYYSTDTEAPVLIQSGCAFRNSTAGDINTFYLGSNGGSAGFIDNMYVDSSGSNLTHPLEVTGLVPKAATLNVENNFTLSSGAVLEFDVSGSLYDRLEVGGAFNASGTLKVTLAPELPAPWTGDHFDLFDAVGGTVSFNAFDLPDLAEGLSWDTSAIGSGVLSVTGAPSGYTGYMYGYGISSGLFGDDANSNGIPNGMEYYLGWSPSNPLSPPGIFTWTNEYLSVVYPYNSSAYGVTGMVEWTTNLISNHWNSAGITYFTNSAPDEIEAYLGATTTNQLFIRLKVEH